MDWMNETLMTNETLMNENWMKNWTMKNWTKNWTKNWMKNFLMSENNLNYPFLKYFLN
jgi:hypothetical protein